MRDHLLFSVDGVQCALPLSAVRIVLQMVQPSPAEERPYLAGTVNYHGQVIPVRPVRAFFGLPDHPPRITDKLIIADAGAGPVGLWVDETHVIQMSPVLPASPEEAGVRKQVVPGVDVTADGIFLFSDLSLYPGQGPVPVIDAGSYGLRDRGKTPAGPGDDRTGPEAPEKKILLERAERIASPGIGATEAGIVEVLRFQLAYQEYALEMQFVREVILTGEITPVPGAPPFISGICAARGQIISLVDLRVLLALPEKGLTDLNRVIVITDGHMTFGILADNITGMGTIPSFLIVPEPGPASAGKRYRKGQVSGSLAVLDAAAILADPALVVEDS